MKNEILVYQLKDRLLSASARNRLENQLNCQLNNQVNNRLGPGPRTQLSEVVYITLFVPFNTQLRRHVSVQTYIQIDKEADR